MRLLFRIPVFMYEAHLGWAFGHRVLMLTHRGRKTGKTRRTCIEVIHYDPAVRESVVISAYGTRSDWYRNIAKNPPIEVRIARERYVPAFRILPTDEARRILREVFAEHPRKGKFFFKHVFRLDFSRWSFEDLASLVPLVAFKQAEG